MFPVSAASSSSRCPSGSFARYIEEMSDADDGPGWAVEYVLPYDRSAGSKGGLSSAVGEKNGSSCMVQPAWPVRWGVLVRGSVSARSKRSGSSVASILAQLVRRRVNAPLLSEAVREGEGGTELPSPVGVPVRSMAEDEEDPADSVCWCPSIYQA